MSAQQLAESQLLNALPRRWQHSLGVAQRARQLAPLVQDQAETLEASAVLHDVGYAPDLVDTGFHPLDGARFLRSIGVDELVVRLVGNHSYALLEAEERGLREVLSSEFPLVDQPLLVDALVFCDMTTTPDGLPTSSEERVGEILSRYGQESIVGRFIRRAAPEIHASVERIRTAAATAGLVL
ncbi:HD domain-containing protein [Kineosporia sp. J2-2]|uniref:HD domain-containing protein n=1 Tax=Kineosporia corallincola TaxID=2835133 RepID=A0ABS5TTM6_9ACTN|nr:HD domain-containing protein [Kineosporia corallincola]